MFLTGNLELAWCCERRVDSPDFKDAAPHGTNSGRATRPHAGYRLPEWLGARPNACQMPKLTHGFPLIEHFLPETAKIIGRISLTPWLAMGPFPGTPRLVAGGRSRMLPSLYSLLRTHRTSQNTTNLRLPEPDSWPRLRIFSDLLDLGHSQ